MSEAETKAPPINVQMEILEAYRGNIKQRIFSLMGPNGAGKTRLLQELETYLRNQNVPVLRLPAERTIMGGPQQNVIPSESPATLKTMLAQRSIAMGNAVFWTADSFFKSVEPRERGWGTRSLNWHRKGRVGPEPPIPIDQINQLGQVISALLKYPTQLGMQAPQQPEPNPLVMTARGRPPVQVQQQQLQPNVPATPVFSFQRGNTWFHQGALSDGEKQLLMLCWLLVDERDTRFVFLVDEPELYLNEARAIEFWQEIERYLPFAIFLYATHNVVFATRSSVDRTFLMGMDQKIEVLPRDQPVPLSVIRDMVGARIQILRISKPIIFCEDTLIRYVAADLLSVDAFEFVVLEGSHMVTAAVSKESRSWSKIRSPWQHCGIIDRDARNDAEVKKMADKNVYCFPFFEAESVLLVPAIATRVLSLKKGGPVSEDAYVPALLEAARAARERTLKQVSAHLCRWHNSELSYREADNGELIVEAIAPLDLEKEFRVRAKELSDVIESGDVGSILRLFDGKELCSIIANRSHALFGVEFGAHPQSDYRVLQQSQDSSDMLRGIAGLQSWADQIRAHLSAVA